MSDDIDQDAEGTDEQCRWCAEGGKLICCDYCNNAFCRSCVQRNFGRAVLHTVISETDRKWRCYVCDPEPLRPLIVACKAAFKRSQEDTPGKRRPSKRRGRTGWPDDANDCDIEEDGGKSKQENRGLRLKCATTGEKALFKFSPHHSGGADHYKDLILPREAFKKARRLSEASQRLAGSFLAFLSSEHTDTSGGSRKTLGGLQRLRAFRAVLIDLRKAQSELQLRVEEEIRIRKSKEQERLGQTVEMKNSKTKKVKNADEGKCFAAMKEKQEVDMKKMKDSPRSNRLAEKAVSDMEDCKPLEDLVEPQDQTMDLKVNEKNKQKRKLRTNGEDDEEICKDGNRVHTKEVVKETRKGKKLKIEEKIKMEDGDLDTMQEIDEEVEQLHKSESELTKKGVKDVIHSESKKEKKRKLSQPNKKTEDEKSEAERIDFGNQDSQDLQNNASVNEMEERHQKDKVGEMSEKGTDEGNDSKDDQDTSEGVFEKEGEVESMEESKADHVAKSRRGLRLKRQHRLRQRDGEEGTDVNKSDDVDKIDKEKEKDTSSDGQKSSAPKNKKPQQRGKVHANQEGINTDKKEELTDADSDGENEEMEYSEVAAEISEADEKAVVERNKNGEDQPSIGENDFEDEILKDVEPQQQNDVVAQDALESGHRRELVVSLCPIKSSGAISDGSALIAVDDKKKQAKGKDQRSKRRQKEAEKDAKRESEVEGTEEASGNIPPKLNMQENLSEGQENGDGEDDGSKCAIVLKTFKAETPVKRKTKFKSKPTGNSEVEEESDCESETRRFSPRQKTTPLRRSSARSRRSSGTEHEADGTTESETGNGQTNEKADCSAKPERQNAHQETVSEGSDANHKGHVNASAETSDSDEMPDVLKQAHHNCTTSSDSVESDSKPKRRGIKRLRGSLTSKRKRRASSDLSDTKKKGKQVKKSSNKRRRQDDDDNTVVHSDSSNFDSDLEKEIAGFCSLPANRKSSKKKQSEGNEEEGEGNSQESDNGTRDGPLGSGDNSETGLSELLAKKKGKGQGKKEKMMKTKDAKKEKVTSSEMSEDEDEAAKKAEDGEDEQLSSDDETQQIRPIIENAQHPQGNLMQSSEEELNGRNSDVLDEDADSEDDPENRIAKKMLLKEIMCGQLSDESSSNADSDELSGGKTTFGKNGKKSGKKRKGQDVNDDDEEDGEDDNEEDDDEGSDSDFEVGRKSRYRHHLLRHKLTESDSDKGKAKLKKKKKKKHSSKEEDDDDEDEDGDKKGKQKGKGNRHSTSTAESSDDAESEAESDSDSESDGDSEQKSELDEDGSSSGENVKKKSYHTRSNKKAENKKQRSYKGKKKKRRRIKVQDSSSGSDKSDKESEGSDDDGQKSPGKGRKKIRKIIKDDKLRGVTQQALKEEEDRRKRVADREKERIKLREVIVIEDSTAAACPITTKLVLEEDAETKEALVQVHDSLVCKLKPHQVDGVQFMWDCCIETVKKTQKEGGSGCIVAHCMGLGKTLQVVAFLHTVLRTDLLKFRNALIVCPLNTVLNWINEFQIWLGDIEDEPEVWELTTVKRVVDRARMLRHWMDDGGIMIMGYEMYRNLTSGRSVKSKKQREIIEQSLVDPGPDFVICDEGHILKNELSAISKAMNAIRTRRRIVLTGTPLQNNLLEYHCMVNFIKENLLGSSREFRNRFINPIQNGQCSDSTLSDVRVMKKRAHILYELLAGCVQRKDYTALTKFLPPKHEYVLSIRLSPLQCQLYRHYLDHFSGCAIQNEAGKSRAGTKLFTDYQMLSRIWTHPWCLQLDYISKENRGYFDAEDSMDDFIASSDEDSSVSCLTDSEPSTSKKKAKGKKHTGRSDEEKKVKSENSDSEGLEVVKVWNTRSRGGGGQQEIGESATPDAENTIKNEDESAPPAVAECTHAAEWYKEFVKEDDADKLEHSGKLHILFEILRMAEELTEKVLVFSQSLISLDLIEGFLKLSNNECTDDKPNPYKGPGKWYRNIDYYRMDGSTSAMTRKKWAEDFNDEVNTRGRLFLISTKAGSLGINLVAANRVIVFDASWNPSYDIQSIFRVYRFGQNKHVFVYRFLAQGTMEEKIYDRQVTKQSLSFRVVDQQQVERHFTMHELSELYNFEPDHLDDPNTKKKKRPTPRLPKDRILAELLQESKDSIVEYHEHDSLLDHKQEEELTEEERKAAWAEYEAEKKGVPRQGPPAAGHTGLINSHMMWAMDYPNPAAMHNTSAQQLQDLLNESRARVNEAHNILATHKVDTFEDVMRRVSEANPSLSESQMLDVCSLVQRNQQAERRRVESNYQQLMARHQVIYQSVQNIALQQQQQQYRQQVAMGRAPAPTVSAEAYRQAMARYPGTVEGRAAAGAQAPPNPRVAETGPSIVPMKNAKP
uniref:transcriptional regulator ATRX-like n=1 Tax=Myxine glutinosa TaxID=7769 RepID=UPI00358EED88